MSHDLLEGVLREVRDVQVLYTVDVDDVRWAARLLAEFEEDPRQFTQMYEAESGQNWRPKNLTPDHIRTILPKVFG